MRNYLVVFCLFSVYLLPAQSFVVTLTGLGKQTGTLYLAQFYKADYVYVDSAAVSGDGSYTFSTKNRNTGLYDIVIKTNTKQGGAFILNTKEKNVEMLLSITDKKVELAVKNSTENSAYAQYIDIKSKLDSCIKASLKGVFSLSVFTPNYYTLRKQIEDNTELFIEKTNTKLQALIKQNPTTYTAKYIAPFSILPLRKEVNLADKAFESYFAFLHYYYLDKAPAIDEQVLYNSCVIEKIDKYFTTFADASVPHYTLVVDNIIKQLGKNPFVKAFLIDYLDNSFRKMGNIAMIDYMSKKKVE